MILGLDWISWIGVVGLVFLLFMLGYGILRILRWNRFCRAIDAMQRGDIDTLTVAPPPRSLYDFYIDRITQGFILNQYEKITHRWLGYRGGIGRVRAAEELAGLEHEKEKSRISADTDEENLRGSKAWHERRQLWEPLQKQKTPRDEAQEEIQALRQQLAQVEAEIETKESELAFLDKEQNPNKADVLDRELHELDRLRRTIQRKIFNLRGQWGI